MAGFTTCRDMGPTWPYTDIDLRKAIDEGVVPGPRLLAAGNYVSPTGGAGDARQFSIFVDVPIVQNLADGPDEIRKAVRTNLKQGADFIKILGTGAVLSKGTPPGAQQYTEEEMHVAVEEAARWGRHVAAHVHGTDGIKAAHPRRRPHHRPRQHDGRRGGRAAENAPTRTSCRRCSRANRSPPTRPSRSPRRRASRQIAELKDQIVPDGAEVRPADRLRAPTPPCPARPERARVRRIASELGQSPMAAIVSATRTTAEIIGWSDRVGTIEAGKFADLIAVDGDPLRDITELERVDVGDEGRDGLQGRDQ